MAIDGNAVVYCEGAFGTTTGKTAHGLVRRTRRYDTIAVLDSRLTGKDAGEVLDNRPNGIPLHATLASALAYARETNRPLTHFVIGLAPDGGRLDDKARQTVREALDSGLNVDSGMHDFLSDDAELVELANKRGVRLRDVRKTQSRSELHSFTGKISQVESVRLALLGTDSAVGKRTTAWELVEGLEKRGFRSELIGTGQTAWLQGARYGIILDSLINDFVAGELEHAVWSAWTNERPKYIVVEGQGSLMNPAYPGGLEILAATRTQAIILQHAPTRKEYDGFPGFAMHPIRKQIEALELISGKPVVAITLNHEGLSAREIPEVCERLSGETGLPVTDVLVDGPGKLAEIVLERVRA